MIESQPADDQAYREALGFLYDRIDYERMASGTARYPFRLQRTDQLLQQLGLGEYLYSQTSHPKVPIVHIAGTKGKGSTATMVAAALSGSGLKTGLYTSPHLHRLEERFQIDGEPCTSADLVSLVARIEPITESIARQAKRSPSFFELITAIAMLHFDASQCQAIVLEVGLGGRLDSTNVCAPSVTAITSIGLDHQHVLGETLAEIATEKAGICKRSVPLVSGVVGGEASQVIVARTMQESSKLFQLGRDYSYQHCPDPVWGSRVDYRGIRPPLTEAVSWTLALEGSHQAHNAAIALSIVDVLRDQGVPIDQESAIQGIAGVECPGRLERFELPNQVTAIVDAAHNIDSINALCQCVQHRARGKPITVVFGTSRDKDAGSMLTQLTTLADHLVLTRFMGNPRYSPPNELRQLLPPSVRRSTVVIEQPIDACSAALDLLATGGILVICGSFFLAAETREWLAAKALAD